MGIISAKPPSINGLESEGRDCLSFERENKKISLKKNLQDDRRKGKEKNKEINVTV
jgi:hypothetical protein